MQFVFAFLLSCVFVVLCWFGGKLVGRLFSFLILKYRGRPAYQIRKRKKLFDDLQEAINK